MNQQNDEIDLSKVFTLIGNAFRRLNESLVNLTKAAKKRWLFLTLFTLFGAIISVLPFYYSKPVYKTSMTLMSKELNNQFCEDRIKNLMKIKEDDNIQLFANTLNMSKSQAQKVSEIKFEKYGKGLKEPKDTLSLGYPFKIHMTIRDPRIIDSLQWAVVNYLENNSYALKKRNIRKDQLQKIKTDLEANILQLDSLKIIIANSLALPKGSGMNVYVEDKIDPVNIYQAEVDFYRQKLVMDEALELIENIQVIEDCTKVTKPSSFSLSGYLINGGLVFFLLGLFIVGRQEKKGS